MVRLDDVALHYGGPDGGAAVLHELSFAIPDGGFRWLLGPSGAGKTSLLRLLYLAVRPTRGRLEVLGVRVDRAERRALPRLRRRIGVVFQDFRLLPHLSAYRQRRPAAAHRRPAGGARSAPTSPRCCAGSGLAAAGTRARPNFRAASSSGSRSRAR